MSVHVSSTLCSKAPKHPKAPPKKGELKGNRNLFQSQSTSGACFVFPPRSFPEQNVTISLSVSSHQISNSSSSIKSKDPISWPSSSSVAHYVLIGEKVEKKQNSSTFLSHCVGGNVTAQSYHSFVTHQGSYTPRQEHSLVGHVVVNKEDREHPSNIAHRITGIIGTFYQEPVIENHWKGNMLSPICHRIDISKDKTPCISQSFQTHLINNCYLNLSEHSSLAHQSPTTALNETPQLIEETFTNRSSHVSHQSSLQPPSLTGSPISHCADQGERCIKSEGSEIINKSYIESKSDEPDTTVFNRMSEHTETDMESFSIHSEKKKSNEPIYAVLELNKTSMEFSSKDKERKKDNEPIYATIVKNKKSAEQKESDDSQLTQLDSKGKESRDWETKLESEDRDVTAVNKDNDVRENEKKELESSKSDILVPSPSKNEDLGITQTKESDTSCEVNEHNVVKRNSKAKRSVSMRNETKQQNRGVQKSTSSDSMKQRFNMYSIKPKDQEDDPKSEPPSPNRKARPPVLRNFQLTKFTGQSEEQKSKYLPPPRMRKSLTNIEDTSQKPKKPVRKKNRRSYAEDSEQSADDTKQMSPTPSRQKKPLRKKNRKSFMEDHEQGDDTKQDSPSFSKQKQDTTTFEFKFVGSRTSVQVVGNFNGWIPEDLFMNNNGLWSKHIELSDGVYFFRLVSTSTKKYFFVL